MDYDNSYANITHLFFHRSSFLFEDIVPYEICDTRKIYLCFKYEKLKKEKDTTFNRWLVWASDIMEGCYWHTEPYRHVELVTPEGYAFSISNGGSVTKASDRQFSSSGYDNNSLVITVSESQYQHCIGFLEDRRLQKDKFYNNFELSFIPVVKWFVHQPDNEWFCSQLIATALQTTGIMDRSYDPKKITPQLLYDYMILQRNCTKTPKSGFVTYNDV